MILNNRFKSRARQLSCGILCALMLAGCGSEPEVSKSSEQSFTVTFSIGSEERIMEAVPGSTCSMEVEPQKGYYFCGWLDEAGNEVDPEHIQVTRDRTYKAMIYPDLYNHAPYLFPDENGNACPWKIMTGMELQKALEVLSPGRSAFASISLPDANASVTTESLHSTLITCFPESRVQDSMGFLPDGQVTRGDFAQILNPLLDRGGDELLTLDLNQQVPPDLDFSTAVGCAMGEAMLIHTSGSGQILADAALVLHHEPGPFWQNGYLYYADENGKVLQNTALGTLKFGSDGRYTSGDTELDSMVAERLSKIIAENQGATQEELLRAAFLYCRDSFQYVNRGLLEFGATGWEIEWAKQMFETGAGNCYNYAGSFWALARGLGYDAYCYSGETAVDHEPHGWTQIDMDGEPYIFDTELAMAYLRDGKQYEKVYKMPLWLAARWPYFWPSDR